MSDALRVHVRVKRKTRGEVRGRFRHTPVEIEITVLAERPQAARRSRLSLISGVFFTGYTLYSALRKTGHDLLLCG